MRNKTIPRLACLCLGVFFLLSARAAESPPPASSQANIVILSHPEPSYRLGSWIWDRDTQNNQYVHLWKSFEIPHGAQVHRARIWMTADNGYHLKLDGREIGEGSDWRSLTEYDVSWVLGFGTHTLAVKGFNDADQAGVIFGMVIELADGQEIEVLSDQSWYVVPAGETHWHWEQMTRPGWNWYHARLVGALGASPWWRNPVRMTARPPVLPIMLHFWQQAWFQVTMLSACGLTVLACLWLMTQLALQSKAQRLLQLERARIARDIHDDLGAGLTQVVLLGEVAQSELPQESATRAQIDQFCEKARDLSRTLDEILWAINSRRDTLRDFATYVCKYAQAFLRPTPIRCRLDVEPELPPLPFDLPIRRNLFLAVKEALNNAAKHSQATELFLRIHRQGSGLAVVVEDNGKGFDLARASQERNGLTNMSQRMEEVGGQYRIACVPGAGCRVEFAIPRLHTPDRALWLRRFGLNQRASERPSEPGTVPIGQPGSVKT